MFKNIFSAKGRIRRTEYGLSWVISFTVFMLIVYWTDTLPKNSDLILLTLIPFLGICYFMIVQGSKRCHDLYQKGSWQFIPFFIIPMLFKEGKRRDTRFGADPKGVQTSAANAGAQDLQVPPEIPATTNKYA